MRSTPVEKQRIIGIAAHIDAGKTTTTERILFYSGVSERMGEVHEGTALMDFMEQEQERGITITAAAATCPWGGCRIHLIDTPGHVDFTVEVERSLRVLDGVVALFCGVGGVEAQAEAIWRQAERHALPRVAFVNKMDRTGADFDKVVGELRQALGARALPIQLPAGSGESFEGVIDLVERRLLRWDEADLGVRVREEAIPPEWSGKVEAARELLVDALTETDDALLAHTLDKGDAEPGALHEALRRATLARRAVPVLCGASYRYAGVQPLLDAVVRYLPSPADRGAARGTGANGEAVLRRPDDDEPFAALVFKTALDSRIGPVALLRIYSGRLAAGPVWNAATASLERAEGLYRVLANEFEPVEEAATGDIIAVTGLGRTATGDTLSDPRAPALLEPIRFSAPVVAVTLEPRAEEDRPGLEAAARALVSEDPTLRLKVAEATGQLHLAGMGELHLEVAVERMRREHGADPRVGNPVAELREGLGGTGEAEAEARIDLPEGTSLARLTLRAKGVRETAGEAVSEWTLDTPPEPTGARKRAVAEGIARTLGRRTGVRGILFTVVRWEAEGPDGGAAALAEAARRASEEAFEAAGPVSLQPMADLEIVAPDAALGEALSGLSARGARIAGFDERAGYRVIRAAAPLSSLFGYAGELRSRTRGRAQLSMTFRGYEPV